MSTRPGPTAYVVDDDEAIRTLWRWLMESNGIAVQTFASAAAFIEGYRRARPGCLVLDVQMPGMSGLELQDYLQRQEHRAFRSSSSAATATCRPR